MENTNLELPACFDEVKIKKIESSKKDQLINILTEFNPEINKALCSNLCIQEWFDIYILSPEFQKIDRDRQKETLTLFRDIKFVLEEIKDFMIENKIGEYNSEYYQWREDRKEQ